MRRKIGDWFHFSNLGFGHSESIGRLTAAGWRYLPPDTKYEALWWNRTVKRDGPYKGHEFLKEDALAAANLYAQKTSTGNLTLLRQFVEVSMRKSSRPYSYVESFQQMLTREGRDQLYTKLKRLLSCYSSHEFFNKVQSNLEMTIKVMLGYTRKRDLLIPEWADDTALWGTV